MGKRIQKGHLSSLHPSRSEESEAAGKRGPKALITKPKPSRLQKLLALIQRNWDQWSYGQRVIAISAVILITGTAIYLFLQAIRQSNDKAANQSDIVPSASSASPPSQLTKSSSTNSSISVGSSNSTSQINLAPDSPLIRSHTRVLIDKSPSTPSAPRKGITVNIYGIAGDEKTLGLSPEKYEEQVKTYRTRVYRLLKYAIDIDILEAICDHPLGHAIYLQPSSVREGGGYSVKTNSIYLEMDPKFSDSTFVNLLRNEYLHAILCLPFEKRESNSGCLPRLNVNTTDLEEIMRRGDEEVQRIEQLFRTAIKSPAALSNPVIQEFLQAVQCYSPMENVEYVPSNEHSIRSVTWKYTPQRDGRWFFKAGDLTITTGPVNVDMYIKADRIDAHTVRYSYTRLKDSTLLSQADAFFNDLKFRKSHAFDRGTYESRSSLGKLEERLSDIAMLPDKLIRFFYKGYFAFLDQVLNFSGSQPTGKRDLPSSCSPLSY